MDNNYKAIISNKELYIEIELPQDEQTIRVGSVPGCRVRLHKSIFFEEFWIQFTNVGETWRVSCSNNIYIYCGDIRKLSNKTLDNGEIISVRYQESNATLFTIEFGIDFSNEQRRYQRAVDIKNSTTVNIGTVNSNQIILLKKVFLTFIDMVIVNNFSKDNAFYNMEKVFGLGEEKCNIWWNLVEENEDKLWKLMMMRKYNQIENKLDFLLNELEEANIIK